MKNNVDKLKVVKTNLMKSSKDLNELGMFASSQTINDVLVGVEKTIKEEEGN